MNTQTKLAVWSLAIVTASGIIPGNGGAAEKPPEAVEATVGVTNAIIVEEGASLTIRHNIDFAKQINRALDAYGKKEPVTYQWRRNGKDLTNGTGQVYHKESVTHADAGSYTLVAKAPVISTNAPVYLAESAPVHISIFTEYTNSQAGALTEPVGKFYRQSGTTVCGGNGFEYWFPYTLYGKNCTGQVEPFKNPGFNKLMVNTCSNLNSSVNTAIHILDATDGTDVPNGCNDMHSHGSGGCPDKNTNNGVSRVNAFTLVNNHYYTVTIWFKPTSQENIGWFFRYTN